MLDFIYEGFAAYYGIDYIAMAASFFTLYFLAEKKRSGFIIGIVANISWIITNALAGIFPGVLLNIALIWVNTRGYHRWGKR